MPTNISQTEHLDRLAGAQPEQLALIVRRVESSTESTVTYGDLALRSAQAAARLADAGVDPEMGVLIASRDPFAFAVATFAAWRLGACVIPANPALPMLEQERLRETTRSLRPCLIVADWDGPRDLTPEELLEPTDLEPVFGGQIPQPAVAMPSGGTSGRPKLIVDDSPALVPVDDEGRLVLGGLTPRVGIGPGQVHLVCTPLFHTNGFGMLTLGIALGDPVVVVDRFDAAVVLQLIERHQVNQMLVVPSVLQRLAKEPSVATTDLSSLTSLGYGGSTCPEWVARWWIERVGAEHVYTGYGATEYIGKAALRGDEWLAHPGSCGRPIDCELRILDDDLRPLTPGAVGEVFMRPQGADKPVFRYVGAQLHRQTDDGFVSLGDFGWVDEDGYLYIADRRTDMLISGGANVYPAEVEGVLTEHPRVLDAGVIGLPDDAWGHRIHAVVQPRDPSAPPDEAELREWCRDRLAPYKCPKSFEIVEELPRTPVGKLLRRQLLEERLTSA
jgi:bile acid-coenzyme A ligase